MAAGTTRSNGLTRPPTAADRSGPPSAGGVLAGLLGLFNQHDRDPVLDRVTAAALGADQAIRLQPDRTLADGASQDLEQLLVDQR